MAQSAVTTLTEAEAQKKLAEVGQTLRRKPSLPAQVDVFADQLTTQLIAIGGTYAGSTASDLKTAAKTALSVVAGEAAIVAAA
jgi:hypothetical protein